MDADAQPRFHKPRPVPCTMRKKVDQELQRLEERGIIEPVEFSEWAAPIVPVVKEDESIRICGDYRATVNQVAKLDTYPLPHIDSLFSSLAGGTSFSKLDLAHAYLQIPLEEESKKYVTINTQRGLYRYNRLPFGVASAPAIFQRTMEDILRGIPQVSVYIDDVLVTGKTEEEHLKTLDQVLTRMQRAGLWLKKQKSAFLLPSVEYLGHKITAEGIQPTEEKVRAIKDAPAPKNVTQLRSFFGLINYYAKFLPRLSSTLAPLYKLLQKGVQWKWRADQEKAFIEAKQQLASPKLLAHYNVENYVILSCDASPYGVGAVLSQVVNGEEKPVAFASRSLAPAERNYAQIDREGLAVVFGVKKFHQYVYGRRFTIYSDHQPLQALFGKGRTVPQMASPRIQRWALTLSAYDYSLKFRPGLKLANADMFSRLPLPEALKKVPRPGDTVLLLQGAEVQPIHAKQIRMWTDRDPIPWPEFAKW